MIGRQRIHNVCPSCGRKLSRHEASLITTETIRRTCPGCHQLYRIVVKPVQIRGGWAFVCTIVPLERRVTTIEE